LGTEFRFRFQLNHYKAANRNGGILFAADYILNQRKLQWNLRMMYFNTSDYQTREFISERDVWGAFSLPSYYGRGIRSVFMVRVKLGDRLTAWLRHAATFRMQAAGDHELKIQMKITL